MQSFALLAALVVSAVGVEFRSGPDVTSTVAEEHQENIQIHDGFEEQEKEDKQEESVLKASLVLSAEQQSAPGNKRAKVLMQVRTGSSLPVADPCGNIQCGALKCPAGFSPTAVPGHCCEYCVNPDVKVEKAVTGATGSAGGKPSTFCRDVWCFPTMCTTTVVAPTTSNGKCCPTCSP